jgi:NAD-dependent dihydropyrimidine dehydrogenase PreA subunit
LNLHTLVIIEKNRDEEMKRTIIKIDQEKCTGCGLCVPACAEGALQIIDGKARLVSEKFCDGLGACLGKCPVGALLVETREAEEFDEKAVKAHESTLRTSEIVRPSAQVLTAPSEPTNEVITLSQWPIQLLLVSVNAPFLKNADLVVAADCVGFAYSNFHVDFLKERKLIIGCPKLDDIQFYRKKLETLFKESQPRSVTVVNMEIPCCSGLYKVVKEALTSAGLDVPLKQEIIDIKGNRIQQR